MSIAKDGKVFIGKESAGKQIGSYEIINISDNPFKMKVKGTYDTSLAPKGGGGDALHSFENRTKDDFGGAMNSAVNIALKQVWDRKINPFVSSITVDMPPKGQGPKVNWEVIITASTNGKAYVGLSSRGGAGGKTGDSGAYNRAKNQTKDKKKSLPSEVGEPNMEILDVLDYENEKVYIRQIFFQYTKPNKFPAWPSGTPPLSGPVTSDSSAAGGGTGSSASIINSGTPSIALNVVFPDNFEIKAREDVPKFTIWVGDPQPQEQVEGFSTFFEDGQQLDEFGNPIVVSSEYEEVEYFGSAEDIEVREVNQVVDEPIGAVASGTEGGTTTSTTGTTETANVDVGSTPVGPGPPAGSKLVAGSGRSLYISNSSYGLAGHRLKNIIPDLQKHLNSNGYSGTVIKSNGIMRDIVGSVYPDNPKRAIASLHGAGLAVDVVFKIPGKKWAGIGDNGNLASDANLNKVIWNFVKAQGDITWGAEWGKSKPWDGMVKDWGVTEYHHFEIKSSLISQYWKPFEKDVKAMGFDYTKLNTVGSKGRLYPFFKAILNSRGIA